MSHNHSMGTRGSMKLAHNLDDRQDRASMGNANSDKKPITPANISNSQIEAIRVALKARESQD